MNHHRQCALGLASVLAVLVAACGGGAGSAVDLSPSAEPVATASGSDSFLLFPNPQVQPDGSLQTDSTAYAEAYYRAIDPLGEKDTLEKWKAANGFDSGSGEQVTVVFGDVRDLGYGRFMTGRRNPDGSIAFLVENYIANPGGAYAYSPLSLNAAVVRDPRWRIGYNAIEFSPGPNGGTAFAKFFTFNASSGARETRVDLDGRGSKAMPGPCITCHGGRGDALTRLNSSGQALFNRVENTESQHRGDVQAKLQPFEVDSFDFVATPGFPRADQEDALKTLNKLVLCTYPLPAAEQRLLPEDACRRPASVSEWQGTSASLIKQAYGGDGMPNAVYADHLVPGDWASRGQSTLYRDVVARSCRMCHLLRGTGGQSDIDFTSFTRFASFAERIKAHAIDRGDMPLAKLVYDAFTLSDARRLLAAFLAQSGFEVTDATGAVLQAGRPIADPGPDRVVARGSTELSGAASLFADTFLWSIVSGPGGATLSGPESSRPTFVATGVGTYGVQLIARNGAMQSAPRQLKIVVKDMLAPAPGAIRFDPDIKAVLTACTGCHTKSPDKPADPRPPMFFDVPSDGTSLYAAVRGRINFKDIVASPLLTKPAGQHHFGGQIAGFNISPAADGTLLEPGDPGRDKYDLFLNWILAGALP